MVMKEIVFKSTPENYAKEKSGIKRYTVRKRDTDERFDRLKEWVEGNHTYLLVGIVNTKTKEDISYEVTDVSKLDDYYIISWRFGDEETRYCG